MGFRDEGGTRTTGRKRKRGVRLAGGRGGGLRHETEKKGSFNLHEEAVGWIGWTAKDPKERTGKRSDRGAEE